MNAGLGNTGVSVVQFVVPLVITAGVFGIPRSCGLSIAATGGPDAALWCFIAFYAACIALTWWYYVRRNAEVTC